jgi:hypothetical protein
MHITSVPTLYELTKGELVEAFLDSRNSPTIRARAVERWRALDNLEHQHHVHLRQTRILHLPEPDGSGQK